MNANELMHRRTVEVLAQLIDVLDCDDLSLLCWHCGVKEDELMPVQDVRPLESDESFAAFIERITK